MSLIKNAQARRGLKWSGLVMLGALVLAGVAFGPMLLGYYRFSEAVEATSQQSAAAGGEWPRRSDACLPCHGVAGNPASPSYPRLAGQPKAYLLQQLAAFASGDRANPTMSPLALELSVEEANALAAFFSSQSVTAPVPFAVDPVRVHKGELVVKKGNCAACHGAGLQGQETNPRLAGQGSTYLAKQLRDFKSGVRRDPRGVMSVLAATLSDEDIDNVAQYLATAEARAN